MRLLKAIAVAPASYLAWVALLGPALMTSYFVDPYLFAFTTLILGGATLAVIAAGILVIVAAKSLSAGAKATIASALLVASAAVAVALTTLRTFKWA